MKAIRIHDYGDARVLKYEDAPAEALIVGTCRKISKLRCPTFNASPPSSHIRMVI